MGIVDKKALKASKKAKKKALSGAIVLKNHCPFTQDDCLEDCEPNKCNQL